MSDYDKTGVLGGRVRRGGLVVSVLALIAYLAGVATAATSSTTAAPVSTSPPSISGTFQAGEVVTATTGSWKNGPTSFSYQWRRCNESGGGCSDVSGATTKRYKLGSDDVGHTITVVVTAANSDGKDSAASKPSPTVSDGSAPRNTGRPALSGDARVGEVLEASKGSWTGGVRSFDYQWERCDGQGNKCAAVKDATAPSYGVRKDDVGHTLRANVTAVNGAGKTTVDTDRSDAVQAVAGTVFTCPSSGSTVAASSLEPPIRLQVDRFAFTPSIVTRATHTITARFHIADTCGRSVSGAELWSTAIPYKQVTAQRGTTGGDGWATLTFDVLSRGFPAAPSRQQIMAVLVRATKPGGSVLAGVSARRIVRERVNLHR